MRAMCGVEKRLTGDVYVKGEKVNIKNPSDAMRYGISFLTEDRQNGRTCASASPIKTNINMNSYAMIEQGRRDLSESGTGPRSGLFKSASM